MLVFLAIPPSAWMLSQRTCIPKGRLRTENAMARGIAMFYYRRDAVLVVPIRCHLPCRTSNIFRPFAVANGHHHSDGLSVAFLSVAGS